MKYLAFAWQTYKAVKADWDQLMAGNAVSYTTKLGVFSITRSVVTKH
jgi:hypothetical protein